MRVTDISSGLFMGNLNYLKDILINDTLNVYEAKFQDVINVIHPINKDSKNIIISFCTTLNLNMYDDKILPLAINDNNYEVKVINS